jgi:hypothetical protein
MTGKNSPQGYRDHGDDLLFTDTTAADFALGALGLSVAENRSKQSQFLRKYRAGKELRRIGCTEGLDKTEPIAARRAMGKGRQG